MARGPKVSVLIPNYNYAKFLPEAIESVITQDFPDFELVISDNASNDGSAEVIRHYAGLDKRIRFQIQPSNLGMVANLNWCLGEARCDYVKFLCADDRLFGAHALRTFATLLDAHPRAVMVASARRVIDETSREVGVWNDIAAGGVHNGPALINRCLLRNYNLIGEPTAVMFRRATGARGFDTTFRQIVDLEMWLHLLESGDLAYIPEPLCAFRRHPAQASTGNSGQVLGPFESLHLVTRYLKHLKRPSGDGTPGLPTRNSRLFETLYYSRKHSPRSAEVQQLEGQLLAALGQPAYAALWLQHKITKPFANLNRIGK